MTAVALVAFPVTVAVLALLLRSRLPERAVAQPTADRWHERPTPVLGGIGIFAGFSAGLWLAVAAGAFEPSKEELGLYLGIALVFAAGLIDDLHHLRPRAKLAAQVAAAGIVLASFRESRAIPPVVFDALATGAPIITADTPAARELLRDGESALLVPPADSGALAAAVERLDEQRSVPREVVLSPRLVVRRTAGPPRSSN